MLCQASFYVIHDEKCNNNATSETVTKILSTVCDVGNCCVAEVIVG
jgi:hypothetical protein